jgi:uncharacterized protein (DUF58 family)
MSRERSPLDPDVLARLSGLQVEVARVVEGVLAGLHRAARHGVSTEFADHKAYSPGDDPRHLDWRVLGRLDRWVVKRFEDETALEALVAVDMSGSMGYGPDGRDKAGTATVLAASLASLLLRQGDGVGLLVLGGSAPADLPPSARPERLAELVAALAAARPAGPTRLVEVLERFVERVPRRGLLALCSDLFDPDPEVLTGLQMLAARGHQVLVFHVLHPDELTLPFDEPSLFESLEDDRRLLVAPREIRAAYLAELGRFLASTRRALAGRGLAYELCRTDEAPHEPLLRRLSRRRASAPEAARAGGRAEP